MSNNPINGHAIKAAIDSEAMRQKYIAKVTKEQRTLVNVLANVTNGYLLDSILTATAKFIAAIIHGSLGNNPEALARVSQGFVNMFAHEFQNMAPKPAEEEPAPEPSRIIVQ